MTLPNLITVALMGWFTVCFLRREWYAYCADRDAQEADANYVGLDDLLDAADERDTVEVTHTAPDPSREPAFQFPGIPDGWSLDRYARDGIKQLNLHLVQAARRNR